MEEAKEIAGKLTKAQRKALLALVRAGNSPYGRHASEIGVNANALNALWTKGLVTGGNLYDSRMRSYRYTEPLGLAVARELGARDE